jgi:hypothetical protein
VAAPGALPKSGGPNLTGKAGHDDTNKVSGRMEATTSQAPATSGGGGGSSENATEGDERSDE